MQREQFSVSKIIDSSATSPRYSKMHHCMDGRNSQEFDGKLDVTRCAKTSGNDTKMLRVAMGTNMVTVDCCFSRRMHAGFVQADFFAVFRRTAMSPCLSKSSEYSPPLIHAMRGSKECRKEQSHGL